MRPPDVAIATMTRARDRREAIDITRALGCLSRTRLPIAIADGGSAPRFVDEIGKLSGVTLVPPQHESLVGQVQASLSAADATGRPYILYTEPDKRGFFDRGLVDFMRRAPKNSGIVIAARSASAFNTFPPFQRLAEAAANELCGRVVGLTTDYCYGPFLIHRRLAAAVARAPRTLGWGWRPFVFATAHRLGFPIAAVVGDYRCPRGQRQEDHGERQHRIRQLSENAAGLIAALTPREVSRHDRFERECTLQVHSAPQ
jgi:hypothetical protein